MAITPTKVKFQQKSEITPVTLAILGSFGNSTLTGRVSFTGTRLSPLEDCTHHPICLASAWEETRATQICLISPPYFQPWKLTATVWLCCLTALPPTPFASWVEPNYSLELCKVPLCLQCSLVQRTQTASYFPG